MAQIRLENLTKDYPGDITAVHQLSLNIGEGELLAVVGPSGCGKTTTLRMIAGLESVTGGKIWIDEADATFQPPQKRNVAMVPQNYALYPHLTVRGNLEFALRLQWISRNERRQRISRIASELQLNSLLDRKPAQLSGGQRQRVALGRALARRPQAVLLDEPLSNLDAQLRLQMRAELAEIRSKLGATMLYVTHDQEEALRLGDRVAVMQDGRLQQCAAPMEIYRNPSNLFVASFIGAHGMNLFSCKLARINGQWQASCPYFVIPLQGNPMLERDINAVKLGVRPEHIFADDNEQPDGIGEVELARPVGNTAIVFLKLSHGQSFQKITAIMPTREAPVPGTRIPFRLSREELHLFDAGTSNRINFGIE